MTPQEQQMIDGLISRIRNTKVENKDTAAEQYLQQGLAGYPDAVYVLAQTVLVQQYGLQQAQQQIEALKQQIGDLQDQLQQASQAKASSSSGGSFLSHIFGSGSSNQPTPQQSQPQYQPVNNPGFSTQGYPAAGYPPPPPAYPPQGYPVAGGFGAGGGFLAGAMQTAAGVAAGELAFQGMESLFHGFEHGGGSGFGGGMGGGETVVNNYYDDSGDRGGRDEDRGRNDSSFYNPSDDASRSDSGAQFADTGSDRDDSQNLSGNDTSFDDNSTDDATFDDNSGIDDGGSNDLGGGF